MNRQKKLLLNKTYLQFMEIGLSSNNISSLKNIVDPGITGYGTTVDERLLSLAELQFLLKSQKKQSKGLKLTWKKKPMSRHIAADENSAVFADDLFLKAVAGNETIKMYLRFSVSLEYRNEKWVVVHWHGSKPENVQSEVDTYGIENWKQKAESLEKLVKERTSDLVEKNRELEIEAVLERVRARAMAMHNSNELGEVAVLLLEQIKHLGIETYTSGFNIWDKEKKNVVAWMSNPTGEVIPPLAMNIRSSKQHLKTYNAWKKQELFFENDIKGNDLTKHYQFLRTIPFYKEAIKQSEAAGIKIPARLIHNIAFFSKGYLLFITLEPCPQFRDIFIRFAKVFEQTYTRFLDLQNAEAQVREAQIEASLERVRSRSLAMHHTSELQEVIHTVHKELLNLDIAIDGGSFIAINSDVNTQLRCWGSGGTADTSEEMVLPLYEKPFCSNLIKGIKKGMGFFTEEYSQQEKNEFFTFLFKHRPWSKLTIKQKKETLSSPGGYTRSCSVSKHTSIFIINHLGKIFSGADNDILKRFGKVFEQSYTRFLDLQKAEAQAREAQIEAGLERVRSRTMAMHSSDDVGAATATMFTELEKLGVQNLRGGIAIINPDQTQEVWSITNLSDGTVLRAIGVFDMRIHPFWQQIFEAHKRKEDFDYYWLAGKDKEDYVAIINTTPGYLPQPIREFPDVHIQSYYFGEGAIWTNSLQPHLEEHKLVMKKFASVFSLTFRRYQDLQKAEAQAREALIEASLERIRAKAMSMHRSEELDEVLTVLFEQFDVLGITPMSTHMTLIDIESNTFTFRETGKGGRRSFGEQVVAIDSMDIWKNEAEKWRTSEPLSINSLHFPKESLPMLWQVFHETFASMPEDARLTPDDYPDGIYHTAGNCQFGYIGMNQTRPATKEEEEIVLKFATEFGRFYQRFLDLKKAEAQTKEAQIEAGLERVRSRAMAMQSSEEVNALIGTVFTELTRLDLLLTRCIIWVFEPATLAARWWMANIEEPSNPMNFYLQYHEHPAYLAFVEEWKKQNAKFVYDLNGQDKINWDEILFNETELKNLPDVVKNGMRAPERVLLSASFNNFGGLNVASLELLSDEHFNILLRFAKVFDLTYTRFLDLKNAEAQAREAKIEAALEKVRSRTMAMQSSNELQETASVLFQEFKKLGTEDIYQVTIGIYNEEEGFIDFRTTSWANSGEYENRSFNLEMKEPTVIMPAVTAWKANKKSAVIDLTGEALEGWLSYRNKMSGVTVKSTDTAGRRVITAAFYSKGHLSISTPVPVPEETLRTLERFAAVFDATYTRFLDLKKAEAQAREAKIEAGLERVRSRTMAMHKSDELTDAAALLFRQVEGLGIKTWTTGFNVWSDDNNYYTDYVTSSRGAAIEPYTIDTSAYVVFRKVSEAKKRGDEFFINFEEGEGLKETYRQLSSFNNKAQFDKMLEDGFQFPTQQYEHFVFGAKVSLMFITYEPVPEAHDIFKRFGKVFEQTYTRFLDLQKAEVQAREAQIETSLERIRAAAMAMHSSESILEVTQVLREQIVLLGEKDLESILVHIYGENPNQYEAWYSYRHPEFPEKRIVNGKQFLSWEQTARARKDKEKYKEQETDYTIVADYKMLHEWYNYLLSVVPEVVQLNNDGSILVPDVLYYNYSKITGGALLLITNSEASDHSKYLLKRAAAVFNLAYSRFLDLQKAEAQAREAQIEAGLERVRSRTMAMHKSDELAETAAVMFRQLIDLGIAPNRLYISIIKDENSDTEFWITDEDGSKVSMAYTANLNDNRSFKKMLNGWKEEKQSLIIDMQGDELQEYFKHLTQLNIPFKRGLEQKRRIQHLAYFGKGFIGMASPDEQPKETIQLLERFAAVFNLTYTRFNDLQVAEAQAREAVIEASLERMRSVAMSIRKSEELIQVAQSLYNELRGLGITNIRNAQIVIKVAGDETYLVCVFSDESSEVIREFRYNTSPITQKMYEELETSSEALYQRELTGKEFEQWLKWREDTGAKIETKLLEARSVTFCLYSIGEGHLGISAYNDITKEQLSVLKRFRNVFELSYRRFMDVAKSEEQSLRLQQEKDRLENALNDLQATQKQLIQSEKMASLGELTAGIAHEIQNPLNFVNNFSEVSKELLDEMKAAIEKGDAEEVKEIMNDVIQNLEKINHHGKRADGIVKGMLQHSRKSEGKKEETDINALCDEYLRLSYHGLRAKDKSFNAKFETDFDPSVQKINVVSQDIGRVILNLINNAFYAASLNPSKGETLKPGSQKTPTVWVITRKEGDKVLISVKDNGNGIPKNIMDKIFQPFFTTKPTGQGTGLGLSLSYDIVKAHGGEIKVETKEGEGTEFIIQLPV